jgi:hypothetical protein
VHLSLDNHLLQELTWKLKQPRPAEKSSSDLLNASGDRPDYHQCSIG